MFVPIITLPHHHRPLPPLGLGGGGKVPRDPFGALLLARGTSQHSNLLLRVTSDSMRVLLTFDAVTEEGVWFKGRPS